MASPEEHAALSAPAPGYEPARAAKLRGRAAQPPPIPQTRPEAVFGASQEDGLRMLAALQTLTSLEPDYSDDLAAEASVTIIETAGSFASGDPVAGKATGPRPLRRQIDENGEPQLLLNGYETFLGPGDEAIVEIVEISRPQEEPQTVSEQPCPTQSASLVERLSNATGRGSRFFKALSGA